MKSWAVLASLILAVATVVAFWPSVHHGFFPEYDDNLYVAANPMVRGGLSLEGVRWAFTSVGYASNWHPLTWLSLMLDVTLFGPVPKWIHLTNIVLHATAALLLFTLWRRLAGVLWPAAFVATVFALHPLRVESVAWIAERKDVLGGLCFILALLAHLHYVRRPGLGRLCAVAGCVALALLAKPMAVTLPCVMLLLDYWPLGRFATPGGGALADAVRGPRMRAVRVVAEKIPLFLLVAAASAVTVHAQRAEGYVLSLESLPLAQRLANAPVSYVKYLGKILWPRDLIFFYPHPAGALPAWKVAAVVLLLAGVTMLVVREARRRPSLTVGWLWFLGTLMPVIGVVQVGWQEMADRYTYLPGIGISVVVIGAVTGVWRAAGGGAGGRRQSEDRVQTPLIPLCERGRGVMYPFSGVGFAVVRAHAGIAAVTLVAVLALMARMQVSYWRDSAALFTRSLEVAPDNWVIHNDYGTALLLQGKPLEALPHLEAALALKPDFSDNRLNLGVALERVGRAAEAERHYRQVLRSSPDMTKAWVNLASLLVTQGRLGEAAAAYREGLRLQPGHAAASTNYGLVLESLGQTAAARDQFRETVRRAPSFVPGWYHLGRVSMALGASHEALEAFEQVLRLDPGNAQAARMVRALQGQEASPERSRQEEHKPH